MLDVDIEYNLVLEDLQKRMQSEKNPKKLELLRKSIEEINKRLNPIPKKMSQEEKIELKKQRELELNKKIEAINQFLDSEMFKEYKFSHFTIFNMNEKKLKTITLNFIKNTKFQLSKSFENTNITQLKQKRKQCGTTIYVETLNENYVFISKNNILTKAVTLIHELGHSMVYDIKKTRKTGMYFSEVYPKFLELVFSDYLIENGLEKYGHNVKISLLTEIEKYISILNDFEFDSYSDKYFASLNYTAIKENILAICIYMMYKKKISDTLKKIDIFIDSLGKNNEGELLNIFGLDSSIFTNISISNDFGKILETEREDIRQKQN